VAELVLLVLNKHEDTLAYVDPHRLQVLDRVPAGHDPHELVLSPDGRFAYVSNYAPPGNTVSVVDLVTRRLVHRIPTDPYVRIHGAAIAPDGRHAYFTAGQSGCVVEVDLQAGRVTRALPTQGEVSHMVVVSADGRLLYTANIGTQNVSVIERASGALITRVPCGRGCEGLAFTPDGRQLWAANQEAASITVLDTATHRVLDTLAVPGVPLRIRFTRDGSRALIANWEEQGELVVWDVPARREITRLPVGNQPIGLLLSPDESRCFVSNMTSDDIHLVDLATLRVHAVFTTGRGPDAMAWWRKTRDSHQFACSQTGDCP